jgi:hypothetical protein
MSIERMRRAVPTSGGALKVEDVAMRIGNVYRKGRESFGLAGEMLIAQKKSLPHGEYGNTCAAGITPIARSASRLRKRATKQK